MSELKKKIDEIGGSMGFSKCSMDVLNLLVDEIEALKAAQQPKAEPVTEPAKPTPGEWFYVCSNNSVQVSGANDDLIAVVYCIHGEEDSTIDANGRLMAASKRMLTLLKQARAAHNPTWTFGPMTDAIIKEVEGR